MIIFISPHSGRMYKIKLTKKNIVVINVRKEIKSVKTRFYPINKKTSVNVIKNVTLFLHAFDVRAY